MPSVRDAFWLWGHEAGSHDGAFGLVGYASRMTPAEAALYMGIPNLILVRYEGKPKPPYEQLARSFVPLQRVVWSIVGAGGTVEDEDVARVRELAEKFPNITGAMMDDFFHAPKPDGTIAPLDPEQLDRIKHELAQCGRPLELWVVLYTHQLDLPVGEHLDQCDVVTFWTWHADELERLERNMDRLERIAPSARKVLGCYMWDYGGKKPMPVERMRFQCEKGLQWLREGRIEGMIFLASCICDLGLEAVEWTRRWIAEVGDE